MTVLKFTPRKPKLVGFCPLCGCPSVHREDYINGLDTCFKGHIYPTIQALKEPKKNPLPNRPEGMR